MINTKNKMAAPELKSIITGAFFLFSLLSFASPNKCTRFNNVFRFAFSCKINGFTIKDSFNLLPKKADTLKFICRKDHRFTLERRMFQKFYRLLEIRFDHCTFDKIDKQVFEGMQSLKILSIYNSINLTFPQNFFHHIRQLKHFTISQSDWRIFSLHDFCLLINIITINLSRNSITEIVENSTSCPETSFSQLKQLLLNDNKIRILRKGFAKRFKNIAELIFHNNQIEEVHYGSLVDLPRLKFLDISQNYIQVLPNDLSTGCPELLKLRISKNPITELPMTFNKLQNLRKFQAQNTLLSDISIIVNMSIEELNVQNCTLNTIPNPFCGKSSILRIGVLKENKLQDIPANTFQQCNDLKDLDLSGNFIKSLNAKSFNGLDKLMKLDLSRNHLSHIDNITFQQLNYLQYLNLSNNVLKENPMIPKHIKNIDFGKNQLRNIQFDQIPLYHLEILNLEMNHIQKINNFTFLHCIFLKELNLQQNELRYLKESYFTHVISLSLLNIAYNKIEDVYSALLSFRNLTILHAQHNQLSTLRTNMFPSSIQEINLSNNKIKTIEKGTFEDLVYLKKVDLRWNEFVTLDSSSLRIKPIIVINYSVFGNQFECDRRQTSSKYNSINKYSIFPNQISTKCRQAYIHYFETISLNSTDKQRSYKRNSLFILPSSCYLNCQQKCTGSCICIIRYDLTEFLVDCKNMKRTNRIGIPTNAILVDLSANELGYLTNKSFRGEIIAEILYLNHSKITGIGTRTFINFNRLKVLHLENNDITILDSNGLLGLQNLNKLILNHNKIERILPGTFNATPNLEILDLSHNNLRKIESQTFNIDHLKSILLFDNPWSCKCEELNVLSTFLIHQIRQINSQNILCDQSDSQVIQYNLNYCRKKTVNRNHLKVLSTCLAILVFLFGTATIVYVYRLEIQILLFVRFGWRILTKKNQLDEEDKEYDAFVSYHNSQDAFVVNEMLPCLEENTTPAYKLCVHFRDFLVGAAIVDNIIESIEKSKRTILLLTNEFLTSEWCRYEFQAAHLESLSNKMNNLIVVLLEDVDPDLVDGGLKLYIDTKTYLRYDDPRFWDKLRFALPEKLEENKL